MEPEHTVFIIDDDQAACESLESLVQLMGVPAKCYESAESMLADYRGQAGCALIDLRLPGMNGLELMEQLAARRAPLEVIIISAHGEVPAAVQAMKNGAVDFLQKPYLPEALRECIQRALKGGSTRAAVNGLAQSPALLDSLTASERAVLDLTVAGIPNKTIAARLGISLRTVHIRRASLMRKLGATNRAELIRIIVEQEAAVQQDSRTPAAPNGHYRSVSAMAE